MAGFGKFRAFVLSKADFEEGVGHSSVVEDFEFIPGPDQPFDTLTDLRKFWGRDPATGLPLIVPTVDRFTTTVVQHGVTSASDEVTPAWGVVPDACLVDLQVSAASVLAGIDGAAKHFVLGVFNPDLNGDPLPAGLQPYDMDVEMPGARWTELRNALVARGVDATKIDGWRDNHPNATPRDVAQAFRNLIGAANAAQEA
jgi:hypothetical protein